MINGAIVRVALRYGAGALFGWAVGKELASDPDVVAVASIVVSVVTGIAVERFWVLAKRYGWTT